jgi:hypothetical protein
MSAPEKPEMTAGEIRALARAIREVPGFVLDGAQKNAIHNALREYADRMEAEPSADEASAIDAAHYAIMEAVGGTVCNPRTCRVMPILRRLALAIAAIREAPAQADAPTDDEGERIAKAAAYTLASIREIRVRNGELGADAPTSVPHPCRGRHGDDVTCNYCEVIRDVRAALSAQADAHPNNDAERALAEERRQLCEILDAALDPDKKEDDDNG